SVREGIDFFPLTVDVEERSYAAGKIPGSFFRREGRAPDSATLTARLIDRPLRPSFKDGYRNETHVVVTVLSADMVHPHDVIAINAASAALMVSDIPFEGPIGAVRLAYTADGEWLPHPTFQEGEESSFEIVVAGRQLDDGDVAIMMVEAGGTTAAWPNYQNGAPKVDEGVLADGLEQAKQYIKEAVALQLELVETSGGRKQAMDYEFQVDYSTEQYQAVSEAAEARMVDVMGIADKAERGESETALRDEVLASLIERFSDADDSDSVALATKQLKAAFRALSKAVVRRRIVDDGFRIDGRSPRDLRPLSAEVGVLPRVHGSGLFQRGETQVLNITTLGMKRMDQMIDGIDPVERKRYMHHYNFPPFSTGETGFMRGPKRREIGHGLLAERALVPVIPTEEEWPYTLRLVSEVLSSNGSTSMASVCGSSLSLMDAGVPIKAPVAGIAMGLVYAEGKYTTLTDILGAEDAFGDMDFKVAGTADFVTALQLDTKIDGIPADVLTQALEQAKEARLQILDVMTKAIPEPRPDVREGAPKIVSFEIPVDKIGEVIGPKGKVINSIQTETGADISVDDDGQVGIVSIAATDREVVEEAERQIRLILDPPTADVGETYSGRVVNITKFGAFVNILPGRDGLLHISKIGQGKRIDRVEDVLELGQELEVVVEDIDPNGKISLKIAGDDNDYTKSGGGGDRGRGGRDRGGRDRDRDRSDRPSPQDSSSASSMAMSFEEDFEPAGFGDLGPEGAAVVPDDENRGGRRRGRGRGRSRN
ncbi:MAG: polyribonucleotide nucleotidyltransferase, partial [Acidimicrobiia bacterium]|nr:polyribonucleotide nucleotidyltransferase [Acidimicrobiia bacterium]